MLLLMTVFSFLLSWSLDRARTVLVHGADTDVIEQLLVVLTHCSGLHEKFCEVDEHRAQWLAMITELDQFKLALRFAPVALIAAAVSLLQEVDKMSGTKTYMNHLQPIIQKYQQC